MKHNENSEVGERSVNLQIPKGGLRKTYLMQVIMICFAIIVTTSLSNMYSVRQDSTGYKRMRKGNQYERDRRQAVGGGGIL